MTNNFATREDLLKTAARRYETFDLPACGKTVRIQSLTEAEYMRYASNVLTETKRNRNQKDRIATARRRLFILCLVDAQGNRLLSENDVSAMADMDVADASILHEKCESHCGLDDGEVESLVKNSDVITEDGSPTD